jgi:molecular chaperone GrpE
MRPQDGPDDVAAESRPHLGEVSPADTPEQLIRLDGNGHVSSQVPDELAAGPKAPAPAAPARLAGLDLQLAAIEAALVDIRQRLASENDRALARERVIDRQHEEIERLRSIEWVGQLRPVVMDLCRLRNSLLRQAGTVPAEMTGPQVTNLLDSFAASVEEALERCGVAVLPCEVGAAFTPSHHQVAAVAETHDPARDATVAEVVQDGYLEIDGGKVIVPARIKLHRYLVKEKADG